MAEQIVSAAVLGRGGSDLDNFPDIVAPNADQENLLQSFGGGGARPGHLGDAGTHRPSLSCDRLAARSRGSRPLAGGLLGPGASAPSRRCRRPRRSPRARRRCFLTGECWDILDAPMRIAPIRLSRTDPDARSDALHEIAASHGGRCLSPEYCGLDVPIELECTEGHRFRLPPRLVFGGTWCQTCRYHGSAKLAKIQAAAVALGGECLAETFRPDPETMPFRCAEGHVWESTSERIKRGKWCPRCAGKGVTIADMNALAARYGGRCVSEHYRGYDGQLEWECREGHRFRLQPQNVKIGAWCRTCRVEAAIIERAIRRVESKGGALVSTIGVRVDAKLTWRCALLHEWTDRPRSLSYRGWCRICQPPAQRNLTIEDMQELARINSGRCLSTEYIDTATKLRWECAKGHRWWTTPATVKYQESWCPDCGIERQKEAFRANRKDRC